MNSAIAKAINLKNNPVVITWADSVPDGAAQFKPGAWGCVVSLLAGVATKGRTAAFSGKAYGCWGGGVGLGFGNCYEAFPGGMDGFCRFLSDGNEKCEQGRRIGEAMAAGPGARLADDFLRGERYLKNPEITKEFVEALPMRDLGSKFVLAKPLSAIDPDREDVKSVTFFVEPHALSALVVLANYTHPGVENVAIPWAAACQVIGILAYAELEREHPRALVGMTDLSARKNVAGQMGEYIMSFTVPWPVFVEMEKNVEGSFLQRHTWSVLLKKEAHSS